MPQPNMNQMLRQVQKMQQDMMAAQEALKDEEVTATAGGGMVTVTVNGNKQLQSIKIDPEVVSKDDVEMLQDLIVAAINDAQRKADDEMQKTMSGMLGGMKIPGMF